LAGEEDNLRYISTADTYKGPKGRGLFEKKTMLQGEEAGVFGLDVTKSRGIILQGRHVQGVLTHRDRGETWERGLKNGVWSEYLHQNSLYWSAEGRGAD